MKSGMRSVSSRWTYVMLALVLIGLMAPARAVNETTAAPAGPGETGSPEAGGGASVIFLSSTLGVLMCVMAAGPALSNKFRSS